MQIAWGQYWQHATRFWQRLYDVFSNGGDFHALKMWCSQEAVHNVIGQHLANLRAAIRQVSQIPRQQLLGAAVPGAEALFAALLELISAGGVVGVQDCVRCSSWEAVMQIVADTNCTPSPHAQVKSFLPRGHGGM